GVVRRGGAEVAGPPFVPPALRARVAEGDAEANACGALRVEMVARSAAARRARPVVEGFGRKLVAPPFRGERDRADPARAVRLVPFDGEGVGPRVALRGEDRERCAWRERMVQRRGVERVP